MRLSSRRVLPAAMLSLAVGWGAAGCSSDDPGGPTGAGVAVIGNWTATTFIADGTDVIEAGMELLFTFDNTGTYTFSVTDDQLGFCDGNTGDNCSDTGDYTASGTQIVLDPEDVEPAVLNYAISGNTMTITATIDGTSITATFDKQDESGGPSGAGTAVIGNWNATTFIAGGADAIAAGMGLIFAFDNTGTYTFNVTNDQLGLCDGNVGDSCSDTGDYTASGTQIVLDPEDVEPAVLNYTISGNTMTVGALIDGALIAATFDKQ